MMFAARTNLRWRRQRRTKHTFGSARFATLRDLAKTNVFTPAGLIVGRFGNRFLRFNREGYVLVFAKTRAGKGTGIVIPNLLSYPGSVICNDVKGENAAITARQRAEFGPIYKLNLEQPLLSDHFNPLCMLRLDTVHMVDDAITLAGFYAHSRSAVGKPLG